MKISVHHYHHMNPEERELLLGIRERQIMISAEVQAMLDKARQSVVLATSVDAGVTAMRAQLVTMQATIDRIPAPVPASDEAPAKPGLSDEDRGALLEGAADLDRMLTTLQKDIPANVSTIVAPKPINQMSPDQQQSHEEDSKAASQATPLPGTGDPEAVKQAADQAAAQTIPAADQTAAQTDNLPAGAVGSTPTTTATAPDNAPPRVVLDAPDGIPADQHDTAASALSGNPLDQLGTKNPVPQPGLPTPSTTVSGDTPVPQDAAINAGLQQGAADSNMGDPNAGAPANTPLTPTTPPSGVPIADGPDAKPPTTPPPSDAKPADQSSTNQQSGS